MLLKCFAGCGNADVVRAMNLTLGDLFAGDRTAPRVSSFRQCTATSATEKPRIVATYDYQDEHGTLVYQVLRYSPKTFRQRRPDGSGGWIWNMKDVPLLVYRRPQLTGCEAVAIVAGEKDADALWARRLPATTNSGGETKWTDIHTQQLVSAGVQRVVVLPDHDDTGRKHAEIVARSCAAAGLTVRLVALQDLPPKGDVSDYLSANSREDLLSLIKAAPVWTPPVNQPASPAAGPVVVCMADVEPEEISWVWSRRLAKGKLTLLVSDGGVGKSTTAIDVIARITRGDSWPDGDSAPEGTVVMLSAEDGLADTIRPRLDRQGANPQRVLVIPGVRDERGQERHFSLDRDLAHLRTVIEEHHPILVVLDPLAAYFGTDRDSYKDTEVRAVLAPLVQLAEQTATAILGIMHLTKATQQKALYRTLGSVAFNNTARIVLAAAKDPDVEGRCFLMPVKQNICPPANVLAYSIGADQRLTWETDPVTRVSADALLSGTAHVADEDQEDAATFLRELLADGPMLQSDVEREGKVSGWSLPQLRRAQKRAGVVPKKAGFHKGWQWLLKACDTGSPEDDAPAPKMTLPHASVIFGEHATVSRLESVPFSKVTGGVTFAPSPAPPSGLPSSSPEPSDPDWGEV